jgi:hypothetical protein
VPDGEPHAGAGRDRVTFDAHLYCTDGSDPLNDAVLLFDHGPGDAGGTRNICRSVEPPAETVR